MLNRSTGFSIILLVIIENSLGTGELEKLKIVVNSAKFSLLFRLLDNCEQIEAVYAYAVWKANSSFGQYISSVKFKYASFLVGKLGILRLYSILIKIAFLNSKIKLTGSNVTNAAIDVYNDGPNWMKNESVPVDYYRSCGSQYWFIRITGQGASKREKKFCTAGFYLAELKWGYKCALYSIVYGSRRGLGLNPFAGFSDVCFPGGLCYAIFGIINFIIMTRVVKEIDKNRAATRVLHQAEIACDIFMVIVWHVPLCDIAKILINAIAGRYILYA